MITIKKITSYCVRGEVVSWVIKKDKMPIRECFDEEEADKLVRELKRGVEYESRE